MTPIPIQDFWKLHPNAPNQGPAGDSPTVYLKKLNAITGMHLTWPEGQPQGPLKRDQVHKICRDSEIDVLVAYAAVMAWGGRGVSSRNYRLSLNKNSIESLPNVLIDLRGSTRGRKADFNNMKKAAEHIKGLGISFYTKLLYFFSKERNAYILDQFTAKSVKALFADCKIALTSGCYPDPDTDGDSYEWFCMKIEELAKGQKWTADQVEQAMFGTRDNEWRRRLRAYFECELQPNDFVPNPSLASEICNRHATEYAEGRNLPGAHPRVGSSNVVCMIQKLPPNEIIWKYVWEKNNAQARVELPLDNHLPLMKRLRCALGIRANGKYFGSRIKFTDEPQSIYPAENGLLITKYRKCFLAINIPAGSGNNEADWGMIADDLIDAMEALYSVIGEYI